MTTAMPKARKESVYEKYAWTLLFAFGIFALFFASFSLLGMTGDPQQTQSTTRMTAGEIAGSSPRIANYIEGQERYVGVSILTVVVFGNAVVAVPYRKGEKWAWYVMWMLPVFLIGVTVNDLILGGALWALGPFLVIVSLLGLLLPYRKFFPKASGMLP